MYQKKLKENSGPDKSLISRKNLRKNSSSNVFINESLTVKNNEIVFLGRKLKHSGHLSKIYTRDKLVHISSPEIHRAKVLKIYHMNDFLIFSNTMVLERIIEKIIKTIPCNPVIDSFCK